jgi:hypothetical protein
MALVSYKINGIFVLKNIFLPVKKFIQARSLPFCTGIIPVLTAFVSYKTNGIFVLKMFFFTSEKVH